MAEDSLKYIKSIIYKKLNDIDIEDTLKRTSRRKDNGIKTFMTESLSIVINGDKLKDAYNKICFCTNRLKATDAIYKFNDNRIYLIEFKNCPPALENENINQKNIAEHIADMCNYTIFKNKDFLNMYIFEGYLFKESFACTKDDFNNFIIKEFDDEEGN